MPGVLDVIVSKRPQRKGVYRDKGDEKCPAPRMQDKSNKRSLFRYLDADSH